jgi:hypothetical protein
VRELLEPQSTPPPRARRAPLPAQSVAAIAACAESWRAGDLDRRRSNIDQRPIAPAYSIWLSLQPIPGLSSSENRNAAPRESAIAAFRIHWL